MATPPPANDEIKVRIEPELKRAFQRTCKSRDLSASQVLRHLMRSYVADCAEGRQPSLFEAPTPSAST